MLQVVHHELILCLRLYLEIFSKQYPFVKQKQNQNRLSINSLVTFIRHTCVSTLSN